MDITAQLLERIIKLEEQLEAEKKNVRENRKAINQLIERQNMTLITWDELEKGAYSERY